jgi:uncharacterized delta-60 repeat protein
VRLAPFLAVLAGLAAFAPPANALKGGLLDPSFGSGGLAEVSAAPEGAREQARAMAIDPQGRIVVAGSVTDLVGDDGWVVARFGPGGAVDTGFGNGGVARVAPLFGPAVNGSVTALAFEPGTGKILAGGTLTGPSANQEFTIARYNENGTLDTTFGPTDTGYVQANPSASADTLQDIGVTPDGRITATGNSLADVAFARWDSDGNLDPGFVGPLLNGNGTFTDFVTAGSDDYRDLEVEDSGAIRAVGISSGPGPVSTWLIARYTPSGGRDMSFGTGDGLTAPLSRFAQAQVLIGDVLYVMGSVDVDPGPATTSRAALLAVNAATGTPIGSELVVDTPDDVNVIGGTLQRLNGSSDPAAERLLLVGLGGATTGVPAFLLRLRRVAGDPVAFERDPEFGTNGIVFLPPEGDPLLQGIWSDAATDSSNRLVVGGHLGDDETADLTAARFIEESPVPVADTTPPGGSVRMLTPSLNRLLKTRRLRVRVTIDEAGSYAIRAQASRRARRKRAQGTARRPVALGRLSPRFDSAGSRRLTLKLGRRKLRALRGRRSAKLTLRFTRTDLAGNAASGRVVKRLKLKRRVRHNRV